MQAQLETLGQLERRLDFAIPSADIETAVDARLKRVARTAKHPGLPSRQGTDEDRGCQLRPASA